MKNLLVTGSKGFLGKNFLHCLDKYSNIKITEYPGDLTETSVLRDFIHQLDAVDMVFHFAGLSSVPQCLENKDLSMAVNVEATEKLAQFVVKKFPKARFVFMSTGQVYAPSADQVLNESSPIQPISFYAETKWLAEQKLQQIAEHLDLQVIVLRLFNHTHKSQGPGFFLPSLHQQILNAEEKIKTGNLNIVRDLGALQDLLQAFTAIVESVTFSSAGSRNHTTPAPEKFLVYNICSGHGKNLSLVAEELSKQLGKKVEFEVDPSRSRPNEPFSIVGSSKKFQHDFAWVPHHAMNEVELVKSFLQNI